MQTWRTFVSLSLMLVLLLSAILPSRTQESNAEKYPPGLIVMSVAKGSPADQAGLKPGDLLLSLDGKPLRFVSQIAPIREKALWDSKKTFPLFLRRGTGNLTLTM